MNSYWVTYLGFICLLWWSKINHMQYIMAAYIYLTWVSFCCIFTLGLIFLRKKVLFFYGSWRKSKITHRKSSSPTAFKLVKCLHWCTLRVQGCDSRFECERSRVHIPDEPPFVIVAATRWPLLIWLCFIVLLSSCLSVRAGWHDISCYRGIPLHWPTPVRYTPLSDCPIRQLWY